MKYLVKKWKRATRVGSPAVSGQISQHHGYIATSSSYPSHPPRHIPAPRHTHTSHTSHTSPTSPHSSNNHISSLSNGNNVSSLATGLSNGRPCLSSTPPTKDFHGHYRESQGQSQHRESRGQPRESQGHHSRSQGHHKPHSSREESNYSARRTQPSDEPHEEEGGQRSQRRSDNNEDNFLNYLENVTQQLSEHDYTGSSSSSRRLAWR